MWQLLKEAVYAKGKYFVVQFVDGLDAVLAVSPGSLLTDQIYIGILRNGGKYPVACDGIGKVVVSWNAFGVYQ